MKYKIAAILAVLVAALSIAACGSSSSSSSSSSTEPSEGSENSESSESSSASEESGGGGESFKVTFIPGLKDNPFYVSMNCGAEAEAKKLGNVDLNEQGANEFNPTQQIPIVNAVTSTHPDAVMIAPTDESALIPPMTQMKEQGIELVEVDTKVSDDSLAVAQVSSNNVQGGELAAEELAKQIGEEGAVLLISLEPGVSTDDLRKEGFEKKIKTYPNIEYLGVQYDKESPSTATSEVNATLSAHPDLKGIFTTDFFGAQGAYTATKAAGKAGDVRIVTFDATPEVVEALEEGSVSGVVSQSPFKQGELGLQYAVEALEGGTPEAKTLLPTKFLTAKNVNSPSVSEYLYKEGCS